jgi:glycosyltransferase involved in cell wall biosynthesis
LVASRPRCVHLLPDTHGAGAENQACYLLAELRALEALDLELVYFGEGRAHERFAALGIPLRPLPRAARFAIDLPWRARRLHRLYADRPPEILHTWLLEGNITGLLAARWWKTTRVVITQRSATNELDYPLHLRVQRLLRKRIDYAISNSEAGTGVLAGIGIPRERIGLIPNGIPNARVRTSEGVRTIRRRLGLAPEAPLLVWMGRADDPPTVGHKDMPTLYRATALVRQARPKARLVLVGATADELARAGVPAPEEIPALGWQRAAADYLAAANVVVISSRDEGDSNVAGEALMLGRPVATTAVGAHASVVAEAGGRAVPPGDARALGEAIIALLDAPPDPAAVRTVAGARLSTERVARETLAVYERLLGSISSPAT